MLLNHLTQHIIDGGEITKRELSDAKLAKTFIFVPRMIHIHKMLYKLTRFDAAEALNDMPE